MPRIATGNQQIRKGVLYPEAGYSRVVSCVAYMKGPLGGGFGYTSVVGERVRLLGVRVWFSPKSWPGDNIYIRLATGAEVPKSAADIYNWTNVLPLIRNGVETWDWMRAEEFEPFEWSMNQLYTGQGRRFGAAFSCGGTVNIMYMMVSFQISEG